MLGRSQLFHKAFRTAGGKGYTGLDSSPFHVKVIGKLHCSSSLAAVAFCKAEGRAGRGGLTEHCLTVNEGENAYLIPASPHHAGFIEHLWPESLAHAGLTITKLHEMPVEELLRSGNKKTRTLRGSFSVPETNKDNK